MLCIEKSLLITSFEAFTVVKFDVEVFWVVTLYRNVVGYQRSGGHCCLHIQGEAKYGLLKS
jgi:hypothetical protein